jgi:hypothetical protein
LSTSYYSPERPSWDDRFFYVNLKKKEQKVMKAMKRTYVLVTVITMAVMFLTLPLTVYAAQDVDPREAIGELTTFILDLVTGVGAIAVIWGAIQLSIALKQQDGSQKTSAVLFITGGLIMVGVRILLQTLGVSVP